MTDSGSSGFPYGSSPAFRQRTCAGVTTDSAIARLVECLVNDCSVSQSPPEMVIAPRWGIKSSEFDKLLAQSDS